MKLSAINYFDDENGEHVAQKFLIDGREVSNTEYTNILMNLFGSDDEEDYDEEIEDEEYCDCDDCEFTEEECEDIGIVENFAREIENTECSACLRNILYDLLLMGKSMGWEDHRQDLYNYLDEEDLD